MSTDDSLTIQGIITRAADAAVERVATAGIVPLEWLSSKQLAAYIGMCEVSIARYVKAGIAPPSVKIAWNARRFRKRDVDAWIAAGGALAASRKKEALKTETATPAENGSRS